MPAKDAPIRESKSHHKVQTQSCRPTPGRQDPRAPELVLAQSHQQLDSPRVPSLGSSISPALSPPHRCRITPPSLAAFAPCPHPHASPAGIEWQLVWESRCPGSEAGLAGSALGSVRPGGAPRLPAPAAPTVPPARARRRGTGRVGGPGLPGLHQMFGKVARLQQRKPLLIYLRCNKY